MRTSTRRAIAAIACTAAAVMIGWVVLGGTEQGTGGQARAQGGPEPPGPFPDVYAPGDSYTVPGERDGTSTFPTVRYRQLQPKQPGVMDFEHFHGEAEMNWWMHKWAYEHPDFVELDQVGTSFGGKPIYQLTITNKAFGDATDKPAAYFDGGRHSGEITASEGSLYLAWKLVEGYGRDPQVTRIVNDKAVYIRPNANPDGGDMYRLTAQTNRSSIRPTDNNDNGLLDDASPTDLNGDGYVTQIRRNVGPGNGTHIVDGRDPTGRTMRRVGEGEGNYVLQNESPGSDGIGGLDLHRNYPYNWRPMPGQDQTGRGWTQTGAGEYPLSEPEIRSTHAFLIRNPNVGVVNSMDTPADMVLRGPSTCDDEECVKPPDIKLLEGLDKVGQELTGYTRAGNVYMDYAVQPPRQGEGSTPEAEEPNPLFGHGPDFGYFQFGAVWYGDEYWISGGRVKDYNGDGQYGDWEGQRWCAEREIPDCFLPWEEYDHPELGEVEIGGINPKFFSQNPPAEALEEFIAPAHEWLLYLTDSLPDVNVVRTKLDTLPAGQEDGATHELRVTVENQGRIPTALEQAKEVKIVRPDTVEIELPDGAGEVVGEDPEFWLRGNQRQNVTVRLALTSSDPTGRFTLRLESTRGGVDERSLLFASARRGTG
ncbi:MAG TPA: M14 family metallopeptidase [Solirubrobacteraceae bacterium]|nr:M14 family metallopeptidase [Solirubrobacteraceae bacterium]